MKKDEKKLQVQDESNTQAIAPVEEKPTAPTALTPVEQSLMKPEADTKFAHEAARFLVDIIKKNNWSRRLGGQSEHIQYEGWQTAGKYYGYTVRTKEADYVEFGNTWGFKAKAEVVNENTGIIVGGAEAYCMSDENNWRSKPKFQLASMAQTRAGSKALRQILGFVVALAGYNATPAEEMDGESVSQAPQKTLVQQARENPQTYAEPEEAKQTVTNGNGSYMVTEKQVSFIERLLNQKGFTKEQLLQKYEITKIEELTGDHASTIIGNLMKLQNKPAEAKKKAVTPESVSETVPTDPYKNKSMGALQVELSTLMTKGVVRKDFAQLTKLSREEIIHVIENAYAKVAEIPENRETVSMLN